MTAKSRKKKQGTAGGAAVAAGAGFQERVAAFAMAHALVGGDELASLALAVGQTLRSVHLDIMPVFDR